MFKTLVRTDPYTGKDKREAVYIGSYFGFPVEDARRRRVCGWAVALWALALGAMIGCGLINYNGSRCFYVLPFYLFSVFPLFYGGWGALRLARCKARITAVDKDEGYDRLRSSAIGLAILSGLHTIGEIVLMLLGGADGALVREIVCAALMAGTGVCALVTLRLIQPLEPVAEAKDEPADEDALD